MSTNQLKTTSDKGNWRTNYSKFQQLFAWITDYDIMFEGSRPDLAEDKVALRTPASAYIKS